MVTDVRVYVTVPLDQVSARRAMERDVQHPDPWHAPSLAVSPAVVATYIIRQRN